MNIFKKELKKSLEVIPDGKQPLKLQVSGTHHNLVNKIYTHLKHCHTTLSNVSDYNINNDCVIDILLNSLINLVIDETFTEGLEPKLKDLKVSFNYTPVMKSFLDKLSQVVDECKISKEKLTDYTKGDFINMLNSISEEKIDKRHKNVHDVLVEGVIKLQNQNRKVNSNQLALLTGLSNTTCQKWLKENPVTTTDVKEVVFLEALQSLMDFNDCQGENALRNKITVNLLTKESKISKSKVCEYARRYHHIIDNHNSKYFSY